MNEIVEPIDREISLSFKEAVCSLKINGVNQSLKFEEWWKKELWAISSVARNANNLRRNQLPFSKNSQPDKNLKKSTLKI